MRSAAIIGAAVLLGACTSDGDEGERHARAERQFEVATFDRVSLAGSHDVVISVGGPVSVRAEGDEDDLERLDIRVEDGRLRIGSRERRGMRWFRGSRHGVTVHVTVPSLAGAAVAGSGEMRIDRAEAPQFAASVTGSGELTIGALRAAQADFSVTGSGELRAAGASERMNISVTGSGDARLEEFEARNASVAVAGSGDVRMRATEAVDVSIMGSGDVEVAGGARCNVTKAGSGDVRCDG